METLGINGGLLLVQFMFAMVFVGLPVISLVSLARKNLTGTPLALWVLVICVVPLVGSLAYWIIKPAAEGNA